MRLTLTLLHKDLRGFLRDRTALALTFLVPAVLIYIFGHVFGIAGGGSGGPSGIPLAVVSETEHPAAAAITAALQRETAFRVITTTPGDDTSPAAPLTAAAARALIEQNRARFALIIPADFQRPDALGLRFLFLTNPRNEIETQIVNGLLQRTLFTAAPEALFGSLRQRAVAALGEDRTAQLYTRVAEAIARTLDADPATIQAALHRGPFRAADPAAPTADRPTAEDFLRQIMQIDTEQVTGRDVRSPAATRSVGGWAMMFLLFSLSGAATSLFEEKKAGLFHRLLASPVRRAHILWSKYLFCMLLGLVQLTALFLAGHLLYGIDVWSNFGNLLVICLAASIACTAFGMLIAAYAPTPAAASGLATFLILTMSAIGGAWFPTSFMPAFIQTLSQFTIVYWSIEGFLRVLWAGAGLTQLLPVVGILLLMATLANAFSLHRFTRGSLFT